MSDETRKQLADFMEANRLTQASVARNLAISAATLSQFLAGNYNGDVEKLNANIRALMVRFQEKRLTKKTDIPFVKTSIVRRVHGIARFCHNENEMGVAHGAAGLGKTEALRNYTMNNPGVIFIEADLGYTARDLFRELHRELVGDQKGSIHDMFDAVVARLKDTDRLIIVDEAEHLPYRALELLRRVYDKAHIGILLCGMGRLLANLKGKKGEFAQLYSRIGAAVELSPLSTEDTKEIVDTVFSGSNGIWKHFHSKSGASTRVLCKMIRRAKNIMVNHELKEINEQVVTDAAKALLI